MRKSRFLTFWLGMIPGAGQMYLGYMKRGTSLMLAAILDITIPILLNLPVLTCLLPLIWFYSFFDALNLRSLAYDERYRPMDDYMFHFSTLAKYDIFGFLQRRRFLVGILCILLGVHLVLQNIVGPFFSTVFDIYLYGFFSRLPTVLIAIAIIWFGVRLLRSDKIIGCLEEDFQEFRDRHHH